MFQVTDSQLAEANRVGTAMAMVFVVMVLVVVGVFLIGYGVMITTQLALSACSLGDCANGYSLSLMVGWIAVAFILGTLTLTTALWMWSAIGKNKNFKKKVKK